ncbi:MAG: metalloregulator ArsR/SmtB family transcription factor [Rhodobacteraceae bacterium]|nr:metalloregulator ArsR/SmtB family transcription factor [Paracoccaceae bacterium]
MEQGKALAALSALAHEARLGLLRMLVEAGPEGLAQGEIARRMKMSASRIAFHLSLLEQAGLIAARRESRNVFYWAETQAIGRLLSYVLHDCCGSHPEVEACCQDRRLKP